MSGFITPALFGYLGRPRSLIKRDILPRLKGVGFRWGKTVINFLEGNSEF